MGAARQSSDGLYAHSGDKSILSYLLVISEEHEYWETNTLSVYSIQLEEKLSWVTNIWAYALSVSLFFEVWKELQIPATDKISRPSAPKLNNIVQWRTASSELVLQTQKQKTFNTYAKNSKAIEQVIDPVALEQEIEQYRLITELINTCADWQSSAAQYVAHEGLLSTIGRELSMNILAPKNRYLFANFAEIWNGWRQRLIY